MHAAFGSLDLVIPHIIAHRYCISHLADHLTQGTQSRKACWVLRISLYTIYIVLWHAKNFCPTSKRKLQIIHKFNGDRIGDPSHLRRCNADHSARDARAAVAVDQAQLVAPAAQIVFAGFQQNRPPNHRVRANQLHQPVLRGSRDTRSSKGQYT